MFSRHGIPQMVRSGNGNNLSLQSLRSLQKNGDFNISQVVLIIHTQMEWQRDMLKLRKHC